MRKLTGFPLRSSALRSSTKLLNVPLGLLFKFDEVTLVDGISRLALPGCKQALNRRERRQQRARAEPKATPSFVPVRTKPIDPLAQGLVAVKNGE
jgi:hypothetical protein